MEKFFKQPSVMTAQEHFSQIPKADIQRSRFDRSSGYKTTFDAGDLIPVFVDEVLPGDTFHMKSTAFGRLATPLKPFMDNVYIDVHYFFVPSRLVWANWQQFMGERINPDDDPTAFSIPQQTLTLPSAASPPSAYTLAQYMGLPYVRAAAGSGTLSVSALPFRAYRLIWNEWYRDENLQDSVTVGTGDGPDTSAPAILKRNKRRDYFTSALPWPQKGDPISVPLGDRAMVLGIGTSTTPAYASVATRQSDGSSAAVSSSAAVRVVESGTSAGYPDIYADLSGVTGIAINDLRTAFQMQRMLERDARGGTRYIELILSHFGVHSDDARLQRPEYLGGGTSRVNVHPIASTAYDASVPQGNVAGVGTTVNEGYFSKSFTEHGYILGIASARADLTYQRGVERMWTRTTRDEFYWPTYAHLGEQAVTNAEIFWQGTADDDLTFGYQERYAEYRYKPSRITGAFNSDFATSLDVWHLGQDFGTTLPVLDSSFIEENPPIDRVIAVPSEPQFLFDIWFDLKCDRPMPVYSVPGLIDHF